MNDPEKILLLETLESLHAAVSSSAEVVGEILDAQDRRIMDMTEHLDTAEEKLETLRRLLK